jgi:DNA-binding beta-propeller fold protein YncE
MLRSFRPRSGAGLWIILAALIAAGAWVVRTEGIMPSSLESSAQMAQLRPNGKAQLVSVEPIPDLPAEGEMCEMVPASSQERLVALLQQQMARASADTPEEANRPALSLERPPERVIKDPYPTYSAVAMDPITKEIVLQDENLFQIVAFDRMANTPPSASMTEPKRIIGGHSTKVEFNCALYIDPKTGDIYSVNNDTLDTLVIFDRSKRGDVPPTRELRTPHRTYGIAADEEKGEMYITVQDPPMVVVYDKSAQGQDKPKRVLRGNKTHLQDAHGIALDTKRRLIFVANYGNSADYKDGGGNNVPRGYGGGMVLGSGKYRPPSIAVYSMDSSGDTPPLRLLEGPRTMLNWPAHLFYDPQHEELYVANDGDSSILVFRPTDDGNVAPTRILKGPKSQVKNPTGVAVDLQNDELFVANMGNHSATVYPRTASGDTPPKRVIRSSPPGAPALQIGNPGAVAYDSKRDEILVPN